MLFTCKLQEAVTVAGKPVTLQMSGGIGAKTVTLMPTSSSIVTTSSTSDSIDTSKMLLVSSQKQPSASLGELNYILNCVPSEKNCKL